MVVLQWLQAHWGMIAALLVGIIDFLIGINPNWKSNSIIQLLLSFLSSKKDPGAP